MENINSYKSNQANKHFSRKEKRLGQFFTPSEVSDFIVSFATKFTTTGKRACDPACGDGVFLSSLIKYDFEPLGIDIDENIVKSLPETIKKYIRVENGLFLDENEKFDLVVGNPPFSSKYGRVKGDILKNFELGEHTSSQAIEILFLEKFVRLCKDGGVIGIILPQGIFSDLRLRYVREYVMNHLSVIAIISLPRNIFRSNGNKTSSKTCILIGKKETKPTNKEIMFASINSTDELLLKKIKTKIYATPNEFLYPEFYLGRNQMLDNFKKLKEFKIEIIQGRTRYGKERKFTTEGIPFISAKIITPIGIDFSKDKKFVEPNSNMDNKKAHTKTGDILFVRVGVGCIGRVAVVTKTSEEGVADDWIYIIRVKDNRLSPFFLAFWLQTSTIQREIKRLARGVGTVTIPIALVKELPIPIPDDNLLKKCKEKYYEIVSMRENKQYKIAYQIKDEICKELEELFLKEENYKKLKI